MQQKLQVPRGNTFEFLVKLSDPLGKDITLSTGDQMIFGVKHFPEHKNYLINKVLTSSDYKPSMQGYIIHIDPEDTENFSFDTYYYDIAVQTADDDFYTVVECSPFIIQKTITKLVEDDE